METLLGLLATIAALAMLGRALWTRRARRCAPGGSLQSAIPVSHYDEIDAAVGLRRCQCRGRFALRGEGPVRGADSIRRARLECRECGREEELYFDLTRLDHPD